ncbi:hypothetical protein [Variovorax sp.]|jgi:hypothetical protein|uniref:hypothetical protein n=1 Tax=Variovorax sp. TaxID=1871043 RepID=UPI00137DF277|nr:hypothetical protein [Variovorax sp.]KAF1071827.1 MAG: hypothetical protein GAK39_00980 [Variovorax sp.]
MKRKGRLAIGMACCLGLAGCATQYQSAGLTGGHTDSIGPGHLQRFDFSGNGYSEPAKIKVFALYRAAEAAQAQSKPYFVMYDSLLSAAFNRPSPMPRVGTIGGKPWAYAFVRFSETPVTGGLETTAVLKLYAEAVKSPVPSPSSSPR